MKLTSLGSTRKKKTGKENEQDKEKDTEEDKSVKTNMKESSINMNDNKGEVRNTTVTNWDEIWNTYNMMIEKFLALGKHKKGKDEFEKQKAQAVVQLYADRADELIEEYRMSIEKKKEENEPIETVDETMLRDAEIMWVRKTEQWDDFVSVSHMLLRLRIARITVMDEETDRRIGEIILAYIKRSEILARIIDTKIECNDEEMEDVNRRHEDSKIEVKTEQQQEGKNGDNIEEKVMDEMDKSGIIDKEDESIAESMREYGNESVYTSTSTMSGKRTNDQKSGNEDVQMTKKVKTNPMRPTLKDLVKGNTIIKNTSNEVRIRFQFMYKGGETLNKGCGEQVKEILYKIMMILKKSDQHARLLPWRKKDTIGSLSGEEIKLLTKEQVLHYIDLNSTEENLRSGRKYFMNGLRIKTRDSVATVIRKWEGERYKDRGKDEFFKTTIIKEAEMQNSDEAYAVGFMMGTTEKGVYTTFGKEISKITGVETEVSYQIVNQRGVTNNIWQLAKEKAEKLYPNPFSKEHRRMKFRYSPYALVVYVSREEDVVKARKLLFEKLGQVKEGQWPMVADGSRMKFIPIMQESIESEEVVKFLHEGLYVQSMSKGNEDIFELPVKDIFERKDYLHNQSLEQIIHRMTKKDEGEIPLFKHITRRWTNNPEELKFEVACQAATKEEARDTLKDLQEILEKKYGIDVRQHFLAPIQMIRVKNKLERKKTSTDKELEMMISASQTDKYGSFLLEGMENATIEMNKRDKNAQEKKSINRTDYNSDETLSNASTISTESRDSKTIQFSESAEYGNELTAESCIRKMREHVTRYRITFEEIRDWIETYLDHEEMLMKAEDIDDVLDSIKLAEWKDMRGGILAKRKYEDAKRRAEKKKKKRDEIPAYARADPQLDEALSKMDIDIPSNVIVTQDKDNPITKNPDSNVNINNASQVSHLSDCEASQNSKRKKYWGGGGR